MKKKFSTYNDGVLWICMQPDGVSSFSAVKNATRQRDLSRIVKLDFCEMSKRDADLVFAESQGRQLSLKVKTRYHICADATKNVLIGNMLYSIIKMDTDREKKEMYLYLEEVRALPA